MKTLASILLAAGLAASTLAQPAWSPPSPSEVNAALRYWPTFASTDREVFAALRAIKWDEVGSNLDPAKMPEEYRKVREMHLQPTGPLVEASRLERCDFGIAYEHGIEATLPHLSFIRGSAYMLRFAARERLIAGDADGAASHCAAMLRMANQLRHDRVLISPLVGFATCDAAFAEIAVLHDSGRLTATGRAELLDACRAINPDDPIGIKSAFDGERWLSANWFTEHKGPRAGNEIVEYLVNAHAVAESDPAQEKHLRALRRLDEKGVAADRKRFDQAYTDCLAAWEHPESVQAVCRRIEAGEYGVLAALMLPSVHRASASAAKFRASLDRTIKLLETGK